MALVDLASSWLEGGRCELAAVRTAETGAAMPGTSGSHQMKLRTNRCAAVSDCAVFSLGASVATYSGTRPSDSVALTPATAIPEMSLPQAGVILVAG